MPSGVNNLSSFIQSISRLSTLSMGGQASQVTAQTSSATATNGTDRLDLTLSRQLSKTVRAAVRKAQRAQGRIEEARTARRSLTGIQSQLEKLRSIARQASSGDVTDTQRAALTEGFNAVQAQVNAEARSTTFRGEGLNERLFAAAGAQRGAAVASTRVTVTGTGAGAAGAMSDEAVALNRSQVARDAGIRDVRLNEDGADAVFRFQDTGNGTITVTRFNRSANGLEEAGSQTVALQNFRSGQMASGANETLNFDRLGVQVQLNESFTAGDLNRMEIRVQTPAGGQADQSSAAATGTQEAQAEPPAMSFDISTRRGARTAVRQLERAITRTERLEIATRRVETNQRQNVTRAFGEIASEGLAGVNIDTRSFERQLRGALFGQ